jgi:hypothetical protein
LKEKHFKRKVLPIDARQWCRNGHESLWISESSSLAAVGVRQVDIVRLRLQNLVGSNHQIVFGERAGLNVTAFFRSFVIQHPKKNIFS